MRHLIRLTERSGPLLTLGGLIVIASLLAAALLVPWRSSFKRRAPAAELRVDGRAVVLDEPPPP